MTKKASTLILSAPESEVTKNIQRRLKRKGLPFSISPIGFYLVPSRLLNTCGVILISLCRKLVQICPIELLQRLKRTGTSRLPQGREENTAIPLSPITTSPLFIKPLPLSFCRSMMALLLSWWALSAQAESAPESPLPVPTPSPSEKEEGFPSLLSKSQHLKEKAEAEAKARQQREQEEAARMKHEAQKDRQNASSPSLDTHVCPTHPRSARLGRPPYLNLQEGARLGCPSCTRWLEAIRNR